MFKLPSFEVTVHIRINEFSANLETQINQLSKKSILRQSTEYNGVRDYHWVFDSWDEAVLYGEKLKILIDNPNFTLIEIHATYDEKIESIFHKNSL